MTTHPINLHTCDVADLYRVCLELPLEEGLALSDLLEERFGYGAGWKWIVREKRWPDSYFYDASECFTWWSGIADWKSCEIIKAVWSRLNGTIPRNWTSAKDYPTLSEALHDCARAAQAAIDAGEIDNL